MTPTTPSGLKATDADWLTIIRPDDTRRRPSTLPACPAAHAMCSIASPASSIASPIGLPISRRISSASSGSRWVIEVFQALRCALRSPKLSAAHHSASPRARTTAARTSSSVCTGWVPTTSPEAGSSDSKVEPDGDSLGFFWAGAWVMTVTVVLSRSPRQGCPQLVDSGHRALADEAPADVRRGPAVHGDAAGQQRDLVGGLVDDDHDGAGMAPSLSLERGALV